MRHIIIGIVGILVLACSGCAVHLEEMVPTPDANVAICHKGKKTLYVNESAVAAHLGHGDTRGVCP